jgi:hypothetical protein
MISGSAEINGEIFRCFGDNFLSLFEKKKFVELILSELLTPLKDYQNVLPFVLPFNVTIGKP